MATPEMTTYATAKASDTMAAFADFLIAEVYGGKLPEGVDEASFREGVRLGGSTRGYFQKSEFWQKDSRNYLANVEARRAAKATEALEKANAAKAKADARIAKLEAAAKAAKAALAKAEAAKAKPEAKADGKAAA